MARNDGKQRYSTVRNGRRKIEVAEFRRSFLGVRTRRIFRVVTEESLADGSDDHRLGNLFREDSV
jgi:hypothetical protein